MNLTLFRKIKCFSLYPRFLCTIKSDNETSAKFEPVFSFPTVRYIALINRLKVYHLIGTSIAVPSTAVMDMMNLISSNTFLATAYVGLTGAAVLSLATLPFRNVIGYLYISNDDQVIKISSLDFWGRRNNKIITVAEWVPLLDMKPKTMDALYLTPQLTDGTKYKLPIKFGKVLNAQKMGELLE